MVYLDKLPLLCLNKLNENPPLNIMFLYSLECNEMSTLVKEEKPVGTYEIIWYAENLPSAVYFYRLQVYPANGGAGSFAETLKMLLLK